MLYSQPKFYHFSEETVLLAKYLAHKYKGKKNLIVCDIFSGSGILGIELARHHGGVEKITGIELQNEFSFYAKKNFDQFLSGQGIEWDWHEIDVTQFDFMKDEYDLVIANPPFYLKGHGRLPENEHKERCHFISEDSFHYFIDSLRELIQYKKTHCYFLGRSDQQYIQKCLKAGSIREELSFNKTSVFTVLA